MKKSVKAALMSAFLFPGSGHFFLKSRITGTIFSIGFVIPLYYVIQDVMAKAQLLVAQISTGKIPINVTSLSQSISETTTQDSNFTMDILIIIWVISIIDSYFLGLKQ